MYLFQNHKDYVRMRQSGELEISEEAFNALDDEPELADIFDYPPSSDESDVEDDTHRQPKDSLGRAKNSKRTSEPMVVEDGVQQPEMTAGLSSTHVFSLDKYNSLYLKANEFMKIKKSDQIEIIEDKSVRRPTYAASVTTSFPYLFSQAVLPLAGVSAS
jgi:hypothetical protein